MGHSVWKILFGCRPARILLCVHVHIQLQLSNTRKCRLTDLLRRTIKSI